MVYIGKTIRTISPELESWASSEHVEWRAYAIPSDFTQEAQGVSELDFSQSGSE
jgi:hypothetical protein